MQFHYRSNNPKVNRLSFEFGQEFWHRPLTNVITNNSTALAHISFRRALGGSPFGAAGVHLAAWQSQLEESPSLGGGEHYFALA